MKRKRSNKSDISYLRAATAICIAGFCSLILCSAAVFLKVSEPLVCIICAAVLFAAASAAIFVHAGTSAGRLINQGGSIPDSILRESVLNLRFPMLICEIGTGKIIWYNKAAGALSHDAPLFGKSFGGLFGVDIEEAAFDGDDVITAEYDGSFYRIHGRKIGSADKNFVILTLEDITELRQAYDAAASKEISVMYVIADNLEELAENEIEKYRSASAEISDILRSFAASCGGIIKEYEHDKYLCLIEAGKLDECIRRKFDMFDSIKNIRVGESPVPVTVSAGVAAISGSLADKEKAARLALETALQRGGDQVVVKNEESVEFYGGRIKSVQKRTKVRARVFANELLMHMSRSSSVMVMGHRFADFDCFGAAVGVARLAMFCGVPVHIVTDFSDSEMDDCRKIMSAEKEYSGVFVDKSKALDMVESDMLLVIVDVNNMALVESPELVSRCTNVVIIDHHRKTAEFEREPIMTYIEPAAAAASELVAELQEQCLPEDMLKASEANMMLAGISLDTKQFTLNTGTRTFSAALYLRDCGADPAMVQELFKTSLDDFCREAKFRSNVVIYRGMFAVAFGEGEGDSADRIAAAKAADKLLSVEGVKASFALIKIGSTVHISARSSGQVNVQLILEQLRGGGHFDSAGAQVEASGVSDALTMLKSAIDRYLEK